MSNLLEKIKYLRELEAKATPGDWKIFKDPAAVKQVLVCGAEKQILAKVVHEFCDAELTCEARNALPEILDALRDALRFIGTTCSCHGQKWGDCLNCAFLKKYGIEE